MLISNRFFAFRVCVKSTEERRREEEEEPDKEAKIKSRGRKGEKEKRGNEICLHTAECSSLHHSVLPLCSRSFPEWASVNLKRYTAPYTAPSPAHKYIKSIRSDVV
jgi:hypothetical protein